MTLDERIKKLEFELKKKTGEDKLARGFDAPKKKYSSKKFLQAARELREIEIKNEKHNSNSANRGKQVL